ncbi:beta-lactamase [Geothrix limicola]|uniref:Beta-lactamase n=1 Tax=Geothrix limicola TaxID=2927978 RepID=A0ABQ5QFQ3_9BACT|nr:subclass B1 metallo-beta-lactamase [Geothrix limicola]GLH73482.1 beta-lactamase [Geothrix limicola]
MDTRRIFLALLLGLAPASLPAGPQDWSSLSPQAQPAPGPTVEIGTDLSATELLPKVWILASTSELEGFGRVSSNALLVAGPRESLLVDVPATEAQTRLLLDWAAHTLKRPVGAVLCTHAHADRIGGLSAAHARGIESYGLPLTQRFAADYHRQAPRRSLGPEETRKLCGIPLQTLFPGAGHTPDNLVVWLPSVKVLFGGCLIKEAASTGLGNLADADPVSWKRAVALVQARYPEARWVVPGHGAPGGQDLLAHTRGLLEAQPAK